MVPLPLLWEREGLSQGLLETGFDSSLFVFYFRRISNIIHMETVRLTASQALVRFLENQYISYIDMDGNEQEHKFVKGIFMLPGHGNVVGFANGVEQELKDMIVYQEQETSRAWALAAVGYAKQMRRKSIFACTSSV